MNSAITQIKNFVQAKNPEFDLQMSSDIIENRLIDSLQVVEFTLFIEEVSGCRFDMEKLDIEDFRTLNALERNLSRLSCRN